PTISRDVRAAVAAGDVHVIGECHAEVPAGVGPTWRGTIDPGRRHSARGTPVARHEALVISIRHCGYALVVPGKATAPARRSYVRIRTHLVATTGQRARQSLAVRVEIAEQTRRLSK